MRFTMCVVALICLVKTAFSAPVQTTYLWHLHQPIYYGEQRSTPPDHYEAAWDTIQAQWSGRTHPSDDLSQIFGVEDRKAAYQFRPKDSIASILSNPDAGAQVNYSGALMENVRSLSGRLNGYYSGWQSSFTDAYNWKTTSGKPRLDLVNFTYHHSLAPLHSPKTVEMELRLHKLMMQTNWGTNVSSNGYFPTEMAFSERLIPVLKAAGIDWTVVSGNHLSRACPDFPLVLGSGGENCQPPNAADVLNPAQTYYYRQQISRGCAPANAAPFAYTPHRVQYIDPATGVPQGIVVVPAAQEFSWVDGYQCFGSGEIGSVAAKNNTTRPELVLLAHDGDNAFGGGYTYYMECVRNFVNGAASTGYNPTTIEQYLASFPVPADDIVHVEDGAWINADGDFGAPTFINWLYPLLNSSGQPDPVNGWHEKAREYAMFTAVENRVRTAEQISGQAVRLDRVLDPGIDATAVERAWHYYLGSLDSGNVYYGTPGDMEVRSTVSCNHAFSRANSAIGSSTNDLTEPTIFIPQRWPYNPGSVNFGVETQYQQKILGPDFTVWSFIYDVSGFTSAVLKWRTDSDGRNSTSSNHNETYAGGTDVGAWQSITMARRAFPANNVYNKGSIDYFVTPTYISEHVSATVAGQAGKLIDYYVEAIDSRGNLARSPIQHVYVGTQSGSGGGGGTGARVEIVPSVPVAGQSVWVTYNPTGSPLAGASSIFMHYGFNNWSNVVSPDPAMSYNAVLQKWETTITVTSAATKLDMVFNNGSGVWDNNGGADWHFDVAAAQLPLWTIDGIAESDSLLATQTPSGLKLWAKLQGTILYVGTQTASSGRDHFVFVSRTPGALQPAPWGKAGPVAAWDTFLANESTNNWAGWFNSGGTATSSGVQSAAGTASGVLEGTIDLATLPGGFTAGSAAYAAAVEFGTDDGGTLVNSTQAPMAVVLNNSVEPSEYWMVGGSAEVTDWTIY